MAVEQPLFIDGSQKAAADLSAKQYLWVKLTSTGINVCTAATDLPYGILQNKPISGAAAEVMVAGRSKSISAAALAVGNQVGTDANAKSAVYVPGTDTTKFIVGQVVLASGALNEIATIAFNCLNPSRGA